MSFPELPDSPLRMEEEILERWREEDLFRRTLEATADGEPFVFYEGPPTANGRPGLHHIISRTIKDLVCRHRTMQGRHVTRIAGWDTHGLPVEIEAEKKLGISGKPEIEALGIARFNEVCRDSVFTYKEEWEELSERIGYWLDYSRPYVTFEADYIESVWWVLKRLAERGLLYRGHKSVPYCPRCGTALSSHEVAQGYEEVEDPSLYFLCPLLDDDGNRDPEGRAFLAWTTTPWTVPSNTGLAVHPGLVYAEVEAEGHRVILAEALVERVLGEGVEILRRYEADELVGRRYERPLDVVAEPEERGNGWTVVAEDFVSAEDGTGIVHMAPAFGADDYAAGQRHGLPMLRPIDDSGRFTQDVELVGGLFVKEADEVLVRTLEERGNLFRVESYVHSYPHCWRCESPLIYMALETWFAATSTLKGVMLENNRQVAWHPPEVGTGRFGEWLANNVDWALSRDRYWGTPLPVWICDDDPDHVEWIGGFEELEARAGNLPPDFDPHRPWIDELAWSCERCEGTMRRAPEVIDVWFDSGSMPYAQWHYPFENEEEFEAHFPADFICEGLDQTRGWFYSLMAIATMLDLGPAYRNVVVNGLILDADGQKMSKSKGNVVNPWDAIAEHGADALRWYLVTVSNPWAAKRYDPEGLDEVCRKWFDTLFNTYRFFALYGNVESWSPAEDRGPAPEERGLLDRWILSRLSAVVDEASRELEAYQLTRAYRVVGDFLGEDLSNWYVRRSRPRFWGKTGDAEGAFRTLWEVLVTLSRLAAPLTPFTADWIHRALTGESVHLAPWPEPREALRDPVLEGEMAAGRAVVTLGRAAREEVGIRVRQPLRTLHVVLPRGRELAEDLLAVVKEELNVKEIRFLSDADSLIRLAARPNYRTLGPRFEAETEEAASRIRKLSQDALETLRRGGEAEIHVGGESHGVGAEDVEVVEEAAGGLAVRSEGGYTVAVDPSLDDELLREGMARELVNRIQRLRRDAGLEVTDRIRLGIYGPDPVQDAARDHEAFISGETLAALVEVGEEAAEDGDLSVREVDLDGTPATIAVARARG
ncbi:MAG: isoleucine--tRNA ligase [Gemmatimonadetes bacterium]|nr:isoleucine--tRNA ligase [Gemmatimonadota bacterium]NIR80273.1 isoleucine--tRNA ligase [Gemmatimonadota bacterium]NIT89031.1 isoleucine--tRNA ligase [Gemmatimonadota bacterium]NIU32829.1 isoleucine--tRNA ligase [Gemmatimonadota bacterium]NIU37249.1 isoleucine--tRNA ligase [Gemmatimonadota bacterium]